jgi:hypothetical protein
MTQEAQFLGYFFPGQSFVLIVDKKGFGLHFGLFFASPSGHPGSFRAMVRLNPAGGNGPEMPPRRARALLQSESKNLAAPFFLAFKKLCTLAGFDPMTHNSVGGEGFTRPSRQEVRPFYESPFWPKRLSSCLWKSGCRL